MTAGAMCIPPNGAEAKEHGGVLPKYRAVDWELVPIHKDGTIGHPFKVGRAAGHVCGCYLCVFHGLNATGKAIRWGN